MDLFRAYIGAFPDLAMTVEDIVDGGDKLAARVRLTGTHRGDLLGIPATGRSIDVQLIDVMRFADDGLIHEHWGVFDALTMMEQLGAAPG
jgi:predicted ester cyclase